MDLDLAELANHVRDSDRVSFPVGHLHLPRVLGFQVTKFMVLELVAAALMLLVFLTLARRIRGGGPPKGLFWNFFEVMLVFIRDEVARPSIGKHDADKFLPFLWNIFFFILFCNLLGILPWAGSPTGALTVTAALAGITFCAVVGTGMQKFGVGGFFKSLVPHMELPKAIAILLDSDDLCHRTRGPLDSPRGVGRSSPGEHVCRAPCAGGHSGIHRRCGEPFLAWLGITTASIVGSAALPCWSCSWPFCRPIYSRFCRHYLSAWQSIRTRVELPMPEKPFQRR